jgi:hypothetical protein
MYITKFFIELPVTNLIDNSVKILINQPISENIGHPSNDKNENNISNNSSTNNTNKTNISINTNVISLQKTDSIQLSNSSYDIKKNEKEDYSKSSDKLFLNYLNEDSDSHSHHSHIILSSNLVKL